MDPVGSKDNTDKYFSGQQKEEEIICFFRKHWMFLLKDFAYFGIFLTVVIVSIIEIETIKEILRGNREMKLMFFAVYTIATIFLHRFFLHFFTYFLNVGIITNLRVTEFDDTLFFRSRRDSIDLSQIQNIELQKKGLLSKIFKYGDISIYLTASNSVKTIKTVPQAKYHFRCMNQGKEDRQRNLMRIPREMERDHEKIHSITPATFEKRIPEEIA
ncbi:MAG: hypothetical protein V1679_02835 [Candidatus Peregrinibacteria bacterium]